MSNPLSVRFIRVTGASLAAHMATLAAIHVHGAPTFPRDRLGLLIAVLGALGLYVVTMLPTYDPDRSKANERSLRRGRR